MNIQELALDPATVKEAPTEEFGFGNLFSNRMYTQTHTPAVGWHNAAIGPFRNISLPPSASVFHYAQEIFEGTKAYRRPDGNINLFRPWDNMKRFNDSARRMAMPTVDEEEHLAAIVRLIELEQEWVPSAPASSLYVRPTMIGIDAALGVRACQEYLHFVIMSPVGAYFKQGFNPVPVYITDKYRRAVKGGVGMAKTGGNYAASLLAGEEAREHGYSQVLWLDAIEGRFVEEVGSMNICFVYGANQIITPALNGSILDGITRRSVITLGRHLGYEVVERTEDVNQMLAAVESGEITEVFGCGTAAVIAPVSKFAFKGREYVVGDAQTGPVARRLFKELTDLQYGRSEDIFGWTYTIKV